jgi:hypothetical protein
MGDGTLFSQAVKVENRKLSVDAASSNVASPDTLKGTLTWTPQAGISDLQGTLQWTIPGLPAISLPVIGSFYSPASLQTLFNSSLVTVDISGSSVDVDSPGQITANSIVFGELSAEAGVFDPEQGLLNWQVTLDGGRVITLRGVYFEDQKLIGGFYDDGAGESGSVLISPR